MKKTIFRLRQLLESRLAAEGRSITFDREKETFRVEKVDTKKGINISLVPVLAKWETKGDSAIDEIVYYVNTALEAMDEKFVLDGKERSIYPVIRSTSFPTETKEGGKLLTDEHTAETRIFYALDLGKTYRLIDDKMVRDQGWDSQKIREIARFNIRSLPCPLKKDSVGGNDFYFLNTNDGYDASRILNDSFLKEMEEKVEGKLTISIPHQDVIIFADIKNQAGYDILAQMSMHFFTTGRVPITSLSFYYEDGKLEPIFILAKNKPMKGEKE